MVTCNQTALWMRFRNLIDSHHCCVVTVRSENLPPQGCSVTVRVYYCDRFQNNVNRKNCPVTCKLSLVTDIPSRGSCYVMIMDSELEGTLRIAVHSPRVSYTPEMTPEVTDTWRDPVQSVESKVIQSVSRN